MKKIISNISVTILAVFVLFLSIGMNISKMKCDTEGILYFGTSVPSCSLEYEIICESNQEKQFCCAQENIKSCCPETNDDSCASETENLHFDFETLISEYEFLFKNCLDPLIDSLFIFIFKSEYSANILLTNIPPPKINKPLFLQIQSCLL